MPRSAPAQLSCRLHPHKVFSICHPAAAAHSSCHDDGRRHASRNPGGPPEGALPPPPCQFCSPVRTACHRTAGLPEVTPPSRPQPEPSEIEGALFQRSPLGHESKWLAGVENCEPDYISCPDLSLAPTAWHSQMFWQMPKLKSYRYFRPSREFTSLLSSRLFTR